MEGGDFVQPDSAVPGPGEPGASPPEAIVAAEVVEERQPVFYRTDGRHVTFTEMRWGGPLPLAVLGWLLSRGTRIEFPGSTDDLAVESLDDFRVSAADLPPSAIQRMAPFARELAALGFHSSVCHAVDDVLQSTRTYLASFAHPTLPVVARLHNRIWNLRTPPKDVLFVEFISRFSDGTFLWSLSSKPDMLAPASCTIVRQEGATPVELWKRHQQELAVHAAGRKAFPVTNREQIVEVCNRLHIAVRDFHLERGVFAPLREIDRQRIARTAASRQEAAVGGLQHPEILAELDRLQNKQSSWTGAFLLLVVSLAFFLGIGLPNQSFWRMLTLVPILLFHECGHYVAMRASGYRNLRMFFIPGLGAAVSGRHFNVPGWKKVIVSLMGPVPGIIAGILLGIGGLVWQRPMALEAAFMVLILNGLNLLPVLPLDGGHVLHTILFSRNLVLDIVFRAGAALLLLIAAAALGDRFLIGLAVLMCLGLPGAVRMAQVARELRREGFAPVSPDNQTIPPAAVERIIAKLKVGVGKPQGNKVIAQRVLTVFEALNTRPPGVLASIVLLFVHGVSLVAAVAFSAFFILAMQRGGGLDGLREAANGGRYSVAAADVRPPSLRTDERAAVGGRDTIVATFARASEAAAAYDSVVPQLRRQQTAALVGRTLFIRLGAGEPAAQSHWLGDLRRRARDVFVDGEVMRATFMISAVARDEAASKALVEELRQYFAMPLSEGMVAPWSPTMRLSPERRLARETYYRLHNDDSPQDPAMKRLIEKISEAQRRGDKAESKTLWAEYSRLMRELRRKRIERVAGDESGAVDTALARRYLELYDKLGPEEFFVKASKEFAPRLGLAWPAEDAAGAEVDRSCARSGYAGQTGQFVHIVALTFHDVAAGPPAVIAWLDAKGCVGLRYSVFGETEMDKDEPAGDGVSSLEDEPANEDEPAESADEAEDEPES